MKGTGRLAIACLSAAVLVFGTPATAAADPEPSLAKLSAKVEKLHEEIETLTEQYNGERVKLTDAKKVAERARKTLATSRAELAARRDVLRRRPVDVRRSQPRRRPQPRRLVAPHGVDLLQCADRQRLHPRARRRTARARADAAPAPGSPFLAAARFAVFTPVGG